MIRKGQLMWLQQVMDQSMEMSLIHGLGDWSEFETKADFVIKPQQFQPDIGFIYWKLGKNIWVWAF